VHFQVIKRLANMRGLLWPISCKLMVFKGIWIELEIRYQRLNIFLVIVLGHAKLVVLCQLLPAILISLNCLCVVNVLFFGLGIKTLSASYALVIIFTLGRGMNHLLVLCVFNDRALVSLRGPFMFNLFFVVSLLFTGLKHRSIPAEIRR